MCGRYTLTKPLKNIVIHFDPSNTKTTHIPRYNIAPSQKAPVLLSVDGSLELHEMNWGLIPSWAKDKKIGSGFINARSETVHEKPSFRSSFKSKRCLVPADGYIEWEKTSKGKTPHYIYFPSEEIFSFAGIWSEYKSEAGTVTTFSIITTEANSQLRAIHHRMPVILPPQQRQSWLNPDTEINELKNVMGYFLESPVKSRIISKKINSPINDFEECLFPDPEEEEDAPLFNF
jgi:putative SOS response-associated peptidase YedK